MEVRLQVVPLDVQDTSGELTELLKGGGGEIQGAEGALVSGALVNNAGDNDLAVALVRDLDLLVAGGVAPGGRTHLVGVQGHDGLGLAVPLLIAGTVGVGEPGGTTSVLDVRGEDIVLGSNGDDLGLRGGIGGRRGGRGSGRDRSRDGGVGRGGGRGRDGGCGGEGSDGEEESGGGELDHDNSVWVFKGKCGKGESSSV